MSMSYFSNKGKNIYKYKIENSYSDLFNIFLFGFYYYSFLKVLFRNVFFHAKN